jgi:hypothetical protein
VLRAFRIRFSFFEEPEDNRNNNTDDNRSGKWKIKIHIFFPDYNVTRKSSKGEFHNQRPQQAKAYQNNTNNYQIFTHPYLQEKTLSF